MRNSIKAKIVVGLLLAIILAVGILFALTAYSISEESRSAVTEATAKELRQVDYTVTQYLEEARRNADMMSRHPLLASADAISTSYVNDTGDVSSHVRSDDAVGLGLSEFFRTVKRSHGNYVAVYFGSRQGAFITGDPLNLPPKFDPRTRPWYTDAVSAPNTAILSKAYMSGTGEATISLAKASRAQGTVLGVAAMDISLDALTSLAGGIHVGEAGHVLLVQDDGVVIANPATPRLILKM